MERIRFSQYVINDIQKNGAKTAAMFMSGGYAYVNVDRIMAGPYYSGEEKDDWHFYVSEGFFGLWRHVALRRADDYLKLTKEEQKALIPLWDKLEVKRKADIKKAQEAEKARKENAAWWP